MKRKIVTILLILFSTTAKAKDMLMGAVRLQDLTPAHRTTCAYSVCSKVDYDKVYGHLIDFKTHRNQCRQYRDIFHTDIVLISITETNKCYCECKY